MEKGIGKNAILDHFHAMLSDEIRSLLRSDPFRQFIVHLTDGTTVSVHHHDYAWLLPSGGELHLEDLEGKVHLINTAQISKVSYAAPEAA